MSNSTWPTKKSSFSKVRSGMTFLDSLVEKYVPASEVKALSEDSDLDSDSEEEKSNRRKKIWPKRQNRQHKKVNSSKSAGCKKKVSVIYNKFK